MSEKTVRDRLREIWPVDESSAEEEPIRRGMLMLAHEIDTIRAKEPESELAEPSEEGIFDFEIELRALLDRSKERYMHKSSRQLPNFIRRCLESWREVTS